MNDFLEEAAALLRKAAESNETDNARYLELLTKGRERIAMKFAQLGAIERGLLPPEMVGEVLLAIAKNPQ